MSQCFAHRCAAEVKHEVGRELARDRWVRVQSNQQDRCYAVRQAGGELNEPKFPSLTLQQVIDISFRDRRITDRDHLELRRLEGKV